MSRKIVLLTIILVLLGLSSNVLADPNLVGYWTFDDQSADDGSGNGYDGTLAGDAAIVSDGDRGYVLELDGDGDYVNLGNGAWTNPGDHMTIAAWIKVDGAFNANNQCVIAKGNQTYRLQRYDSYDSMRMYMNYTSSSYKSAAGSDNVNDGLWHHVAAIYDGTAIRLYVDGSLDASTTLSTLYVTAADLCIGRNTDVTARDWDGWIDEVCFYNKALDAEEISDLYLNGVADPNMLGRWTFEDDTANDSSGYRHDGSLTGDAQIVTDGERGKVLQLDGAGDYVDLGSGAWTNPGNNMSISAWIKVDAYNADYQCVMAKGNQTYRLQRTGGGSSLAIFMNYTSSSYKSASASTNVNDDAWHHVATTYDSSIIRIYIDGVLEATNTLSTLYSNSDPLCIGRNSDVTSRDWEGWIDDVRLYKKVLTDAEIATLAELDCTISGSVGSLDGVTMSGLPGDPVTSGGGAYSVTVGYGWNGTVTPTKTGYTFSPTQKTYSNVTNDATDEDYTPTLNTYVISGSVGSLDGVTMSGLPGTPVTSGGGAYIATVDYGWDGTVTPSKTGYTFSPTNKTYSNVTANDTDEDYTPTLLSYVISGSVVDVDSMYDMDNVTMSGLPGSVVTDANGYYTVTVDYGWSGTVIPSRAGFTFEPASWEYNNVTDDIDTTDCNATVIRYQISGYTGTLDGVGFPDFGASSDSNGLYSCDVDYGWSGTIIPEKEGYTFSPESRSYNNVTSAQSDQDYTPIINTYTISGYVGTLEDVAMTGLPDSVETDATGYYVGTVEYGWNGTVTPTLEGYVFEDSSREYTAVDANQTGQNYTPTLTAVDINMLGWWTFDNDNANDSSGYGHDGTLTGDANIVDDPTRGKVLHLDGDGDYVELGNGSWADITGEITMVAWVKVDTFDITYQTILAKGNNTYRMQRANASDYASIWLNTYPNANCVNADGATSINDGQWHQVVSVFDGDAVYVYVDGIEDGSANFASGSIETSTDTLRIGSNSDNGRYWEGLIDSVRLYDKALTSTEIADLYTSENPDLVGWWKFDGDAKDSSGRGHHGTMVGDVAIVNDAEFGQVLEVGTNGDITDNWVDCGGGSGDRNWATLGSEMTIMAWVKTDSFNVIYQYIVTKGNSFMVGRYSGDSKLRFKTGHWSPENLIGTSVSNVADDEWHHVAAVYDGAKRYLYIDGQVDVTDNCTGSLLDDDYNLLIGGYTGYSGRCWKGYIDDVKLFRKALSGTEVRVEAEMLAAEKPSPADEATDVEIDQVLSWRAGPLADTVGGHDVYFGTSFDDVNSRDGSVFIGNQSNNSYNPGQLSNLTTYYWVIDTNNDDYEDSPWPGEVWSFTTVDSNMVGWWNFDDGTANDSSENGYNGTLTGNAVIVNDAERGKVVQLDGYGDYVNLGNGSWTNPGNHMTIAAWIKVSAFNASYQTVIAKGNQTYRLQRNGTSNRMSIYMNYTSSSYKALGGNVNVNDGKWHHVAATYDGALMRLYVDGQQDNSHNTLSTLYTNTDPLCIGRNSDETARDWEGWIDDVRMYSKALSINEIYLLAGRYIATEPDPKIKAFDVDTYPTLSWKSSAKASGHDLYIGTDADLVTDRDESVYVGEVDTNSYTPDMLRLATTYYWAVDEVNDLDAASPWYGDVWQFVTRNNQTEGFYKDLFIHGGKGLSGYQASNIPATSFLGLDCEHIDTGDQALTLKMIAQTDDGDWQDDNGVLLYPDNEPRFRLYYGNGGQGAIAGPALVPDGIDRVQKFYWNGGAYTGSCASSFMASNKKDYHFHIYPKWTDGAGGGSSMFHDMFIPDGTTAFHPEKYGYGNVYERSPLLEYYPEEFSDLNIHYIYHNGGNAVPWLPPGQENDYWAIGTEVLLVYDFRYLFDDGALVLDGDTRDFHHKVGAWGYKRDAQSGRLCPCGSHPETRTAMDKVKMQSALYLYAMAGRGTPTAKAALTDGVTRQMNDNDTAGYEKIGDMQYHHFTIEVPQGASELEIVLDGNLYDMNVYAKLGDFAFADETDTIAATNGSGSDETLTITNPDAGTWYIGVKCNEAVTNIYGNVHYLYTGKYELLNGISYDITATVEE